MSLHPAVLTIPAVFFLLLLFFVVRDIVKIRQSGNVPHEFPGGANRLAWAIGVAATGRCIIWLIATLVPFLALYGLAAVLGLPEIANSIIIPTAVVTGILGGKQLEWIVYTKLESQFLADRVAFVFPHLVEGEVSR